MTLFLIDASHYQSALPVASLRGQGFVGLIAKATQGTTFTDAKFDDFARAAQQAGLLFAGYHFLEPGGDASLRAQAVHTAGVVPASIPVWVDAEAGATREQAYVYAAELRARGRDVAGIYNATQPAKGYGGWWRAAYGIDPVGTAAYAYAANGGDRSDKWDAGTVRHPDIWQFCQHGRITGFSGDVDLNAYRGTLQQLAASGWFWVPPNLAGDDMALSDADKAWIRSVVPQPPYLERMTDLHVAAAVAPQTAALAAAIAAIRPADVDEQAVASALAPLLSRDLVAAVTALFKSADADELQAVADAVNDERDARERARLGP